MTMDNGIASLGNGVLEASPSPKWEIRNLRPGSFTERPAEAPSFKTSGHRVDAPSPSNSYFYGPSGRAAWSEILATTRLCQARLPWGAGCLEGCGKKTVKLVLKAHEDRWE